MLVLAIFIDHFDVYVAGAVQARYLNGKVPSEHAVRDRRDSRQVWARDYQRGCGSRYVHHRPTGITEWDVRRACEVDDIFHVGSLDLIELHVNHRWMGVVRCHSVEREHCKQANDQQAPERVALGVHLQCITQSYQSENGSHSSP